MVIYHIGDIVALRFNECMKQGVTEEMEKHNGKAYAVSKIKSIVPAGKSSGGMTTYYELDGFVSEKGVPYAVTIDMLQPVRGVKYGKEK